MTKSGCFVYFKTYDFKTNSSSDCWYSLSKFTLQIAFLYEHDMAQSGSDLQGVISDVDGWYKTNGCFILSSTAPYIIDIGSQSWYTCDKPICTRAFHIYETASVGVTIVEPKPTLSSVKRDRNLKSFAQIFLESTEQYRNSHIKTIKTYIKRLLDAFRFWHL